MDGGGDNAGETVRKPPSRAVVEAVAEAEGVSPDELQPPEYEPLHAVVDPDALDSLCANRPTTDCNVSFRFCGYEVTVGEDGTVALTANTTDGDSD
ncbi:HalOD1 output domain-containing protein [Natrialba sp. INN-245]|uniref:HalOD1 output domain-containing protein n=1 Tax=Natrialba sp. INN-245 TaxID=2690967 RepID=UPI0013137C1B|nr:HalOD1 output domain-containing protein [Natrialba sp. INN-245]MWV39109.1 hypothetical protein [Natrialba sp. INN-245]